MSRTDEAPELISRKEAVEILGFVSYDGIYRGAKGTDVLTRFPHGLYSRQECEALKASILAAGKPGTGAKRRQRKCIRLTRARSGPQTKELTI